MVNEDRVGRRADLLAVFVITGRRSTLLASFPREGNHHDLADRQAPIRIGGSGAAPHRWRIRLWSALSCDPPGAQDTSPSCGHLLRGSRRGVHQSVEPVSSGALHAGRDVAVEVHRHGNVSVPESFLHDFRVLPVGKH